MEAFNALVTEFKTRLSSNVTELKVRVDAKVEEFNRAGTAVRVVYDANPDSPELLGLFATKDDVEKQLNVLEQELSRLQVATRKILVSLV